MTSEICVMNKMSIVLAADSATTVSYIENGKKVERYFKGANKIFQLSENQPIGIMIYGNASILDVPWELVIKDFRLKLGAKTFPNMKNIAADFCTYINTNDSIFNEELKYDTFKAAANFEVYFYCNELNKKKDAGVTFDEVLELKEIAEGVGKSTFSNEHGEEIEKRLLTEWLPRLLKDHEEDKSDFKAQIINGRDKDFIETLYKATLQLKIRNPPANPTGIVIAGYGENSIYPEIYMAKSGGFVGDTFVMNDVTIHSISTSFPSFISGFAQSSMADTFQVGFDQQVYDTIGDVHERTLPDFLLPFIEKLGGTLSASTTGYTIVDKDGVEVLNEEEFNDLFRVEVKKIGPIILDASRKNHGQPMDRVISMLPVEEMTELAATMVDLQSLKEKVTQPSETVGGPVDVAIITRNEGFVWKKRKHFFDAEINQRYLNRLANN